MAKNQTLSDDQLTKLLKDPATRRDAFSQVIHRYQEQLYWQIRKLVIDHEDSSDVLQNTLLRPGRRWTISGVIRS